MRSIWRNWSSTLATWKFKYWAFSTYFDIQNVYNNQNPEAVGYNFNYTACQYVNGLPILPSIGIRGDFGEDKE